MLTAAMVIKLISGERVEVEARVGLEPTNRGFADLSLSHLGTAPSSITGYFPLENNGAGDGT